MPTLPPPAREQFERLCASQADVNVDALRGQVAAHVEEMRRAARDNELLPVDVAEALGGALDELLGTSLPEEHQRLVVGAARYFIANDDHMPDMGSVLGLDDDLAVFNYAMDQIGKPDRKLDF